MFGMYHCPEEYEVGSGCMQGPSGETLLMVETVVLHKDSGCSDL